MKKKTITMVLAAALLGLMMSTALADEVLMGLESTPSTGYAWTVEVNGNAVQGYG